MTLRRLILLLIIGVACSFLGLVLKAAGIPGAMILILLGLFVKFFGLFAMIYYLLRQKQIRDSKSEKF